LTNGAAVSRVQRFTVSDGEMVLTLEPAEEGGYLVTSPFDPELVTEAESVEEAFEMARDAAEGLRKVRAKLFGRQKKAAAKGA
jgi:antitoxin HicB